MDYDIIIAGAGCAGLSLAYRLCDPKYKHLNILVLDPDPKEENDRTWCFWAKNSGLFADIIHKSWSNIHFYSPSLDKELDIAPYQYYMIKGKDFYDFVKSKIASSNHVYLKKESVKKIEKSSQGKITVSSSDEVYSSKYVFKNFLEEVPILDKDWYVNQHFGGWFIRSENAAFDPNKATFMDFRIDQHGETRFFYVLPTDSHAGLVEMAIFSNEKMTQEEYDGHIASYISEYIDTNSYTIEEREYGVIPMTTYDFSPTLFDNVYHIGTPAGAVKASSGYAFYRIQEHCDHIIKYISEEGIKPIPTYFKKDRYRFYDKIMLNVMLTGKESGQTIFTKLFEKLPAKDLLKFLNQETNLLEELKIFTAPPWASFTKAMLEELRS